MTIKNTTEEYIDSHISIKDCLNKGVLNYSALARQIIKDKNLKISPEAIVIAARRMREKISKNHEKEVIKLFKNSEISVKNKISVVRLGKHSIPDYLIEAEKEIRRKKDIFFAIEGTNTITLILQDKNIEILRKKFRNSIDSVKTGLAMLIVDSPGIENVPGAVAFLTSRFFEKNVNIIEMMSCHNDSIFIIEKEKVSQVLALLEEL